MKHLLFTLFFIQEIIAFSQTGNLTIFTEKGEPFFLYLNGKQQNPEASSSVEIEDGKEGYYQLTVKFEDTTLGEFNKNIVIAAGKALTYKAKYVVQTKTKKKGESTYIYSSGETASTTTVTKTGKWKLYPFSETNIAGYSGPASAFETGSYGSSGSESTYNDKANHGTTDTPENTEEGTSSTTVVTTTTTTTTNGKTTTSSTSKNTTTNVGNNSGTGGLSVNLNVGDGKCGSNTNGNGQVKTTTTTTKTTTSGNSGAPTPTSSKPINSNPNANGCVVPMTESEFLEAKQSVSSKNYEESKKKVAKQITDLNCLSSAQVKEMMELFSFESSKLEYAKYAYSKTTDPKNYYKVNDAFTYESSITGLQQYIQSK